MFLPLYLFLIEYLVGTCRQGGWSCVGRKDYKDCKSKTLLHYMYPTIDYCDNIYGDEWKQRKPNGFRGFCSKQKTQCSTPVRFSCHPQRQLCYIPFCFCFTF